MKQQDRTLRSRSSRPVGLQRRFRRPLPVAVVAILVALAALSWVSPIWAADPPKWLPAAEATRQQAGREPPTDTAAPHSGSEETSGQVLNLGAGAEEESFADAFSRALLLIAAWSLLAGSLIIVAATLGRTARWLRRVSSSRRGPPSKIFQLGLNVRSGAGQVRHYSFESYPVTVSSAGTADLLLPNPRGIRQGFRIDYREGRGWFASESPLIINGVPQREKRLREGDRILFGSYRIDFEGAAFVTRPAALPRRPRYGWQIPIVVALLTMSVMFRQATGVPQLRAEARLARVAERATERQAVRAEREAARRAAAVAAQEAEREAARRAAAVAAQEAEREAARRAAVAAAQEAEREAARRAAVAAAQEAEREAARRAAVAAAQEAEREAARQAAAHEEPSTTMLAAMTTDLPTGGIVSEGLKAVVSIAPSSGSGRLPEAKDKRSRPDVEPVPMRTEVRTYAPGQPIAFFGVDVLFIHAHPDDESLDFAVLMSRAFRSGKRIATILFTDGESGLDRYPRRVVGDSYPNHTLRGRALAEVRVREATHAMGILGSEAYVRLGLVNRPYNTLRDVVPLETVLEGWGGERAIVERLVGLIQGYRPEVVVSPDGPSNAHEHFEHEAVGYLVREALTELDRQGDNPVKAHLVSVDPFQKDKYADFVAVNGSARDSRSGMTDRAVQALALQQHVSQADASVIGLKRLPPLPSEFYYVARWSMDRSMEEWLDQGPTRAR